MKGAYFLGIACLYVSLFFFDFDTSFAQSKLKDGSVADSVINAPAGVLLELESIKQGFLLPRLTIQQRDALVQSNLTEGLMIFNTSYESIDYWSVKQGRWLCLFGQHTAIIDTLQCSAVVVNGLYKRGRTLTANNYLRVVVTVSKPGNYVINAATTNGYTFSGTGSFAANGAYTVNLVGSGSPLAATPDGGAGDEISITVNGINSNCKPHIKVAAADIAYSMSCNTSTVNGQYMIGVPLTTSNIFTLPLHVTEPGAYFIESDTVNGYHFTALGTFTTTGDQTIILKGIGTPVAAGTNTFTLTSNSAVSNICGGLTITIPPVAFTMNCKEAVVAGTYMQDAALTTDNNITLPVTITATGAYRITTDNQNGMTFAASGVFKDTGLHQVVLTGTGTPLAPGTNNFTVTGNDAIKCSAVSVSVSAQPVTYTLNCNSVKVIGTYYAGATLTSAHNITLSVNVTYGGNYSITTNTMNGISFSSTGTFTRGANNVTLTGSGAPLKNGDYTFTISTNSDGNANTCSATINVQLRTIRVLGLGDDQYLENGDKTARTVLTSSANFGPNGKVVINIINKIFSYNSYFIGDNIQNYISELQPDIIIISGLVINTENVKVLADFVKNRKGVVLNFEPGRPAVLSFSKYDEISAGLASYIYGTHTVSCGWDDADDGVMYKFAYVDDPVLNGPFGDVRGVYWGKANNLWTAFLNGLPSDAVVYSKGNGGVSSFRHATLGYLWVGSSGFSKGGSDAGDIYRDPAQTDYSYNPIPKDHYGKSKYGGPVSVYNSVFYANAMAWAIKYVLKNHPY